MPTVQAPTQDPFFNADACGDHKAELANVQRQQQISKCVLAAQEKLDAIRGEYAAVGSLVREIIELKADGPLLQPQKNFLEALIDQEQHLNALATSLIQFLD
jgi:hypothetical protein